MTSRTMRILNIISGILLIAAGIYCLCNQDVAAMSAGIILGLFMLASGVVMIVIYSGTRRFILGAGWLLLDGIITVIFSLFLLTNQWLSMMSLPFMLTLWLILSGVSKAVSSFDLKRLGLRGWGWFLATGLLLLVFGGWCVFWLVSLLCEKAGGRHYLRLCHWALFLVLFGLVLGGMLG